MVDCLAVADPLVQPPQPGKKKPGPRHRRAADLHADAAAGEQVRLRDAEPGGRRAGDAGGHHADSGAAGAGE